MPSKTNIFLTGATGYIGGSVLLRFLKHPNASSFNITVLVRSPEKAERLKAFGVNPVVGSHSDARLMKALTAQCDVVIAAADADDLAAAKATLKGLKTHYQNTGIAPIFIHTSGTGVLADGASANHTQRNVELELIQADEEGYVKVYIISPSVVYGLATGELVRQGIQNPHSRAVPWLLRIAQDRGRSGVVGAGLNAWPNVNIKEVADLYAVLYDSIVSNPATGHGREGIYFAKNSEHTYYDLAKAIGKILTAMGKIDNPEPTTFTPEEVVKYFGGPRNIGTNSRAWANTSRSIGWRPVKTTKDFLKSIESEVLAILRKSGRA